MEDCSWHYERKNRVLKACHSSSIGKFKFLECFKITIFIFLNRWAFGYGVPFVSKIHFWRCLAKTLCLALEAVFSFGGDV